MTLRKELALQAVSSFALGAVCAGISHYFKSK